MRFDLLQSITLAGNVAIPNEDRAGAAGALGWIIDGATDLGPTGLVGSQSGAAWLAATADAALHGLGLQQVQSVLAAMQAVVEVLYRAYPEQRQREPLGAWENPSGAMMVAAIVRDRLQLGWLGDCTGFLLRQGHLIRLGPEASDREATVARALITKDPEFLLKPIEPETMERVQKGRARAIGKALSVDGRELVDLEVVEVDCFPGDHLMLLSDGFAALLDDYGYSLEEFSSTLMERGLLGLAVALRDIEAGDPLAHRFPRLKARDDATAILLQVAT